MVRVASIPFISGMLMSIRTSAGLSSSSSATASLPLAASPTNSNSAARFSTAFMAALKWCLVVDDQDGEPIAHPFILSRRRLS